MLHHMPHEMWPCTCDLELQAMSTAATTTTWTLLLLCHCILGVPLNHLDIYTVRLTCLVNLLDKDGNMMYCSKIVPQKLSLAANGCWQLWTVFDKVFVFEVTALHGFPITHFDCCQWANWVWEHVRVYGYLLYVCVFKIEAADGYSKRIILVFILFLKNMTHSNTNLFLVFFIFWKKKSIGLSNIAVL